MGQEAWIALQMLWVFVLAVVPAVLVYRLAASRQTLVYVSSLNGRLMRWGALTAVLSSIILLLVRFLMFGGYDAIPPGSKREVFLLLSALLDSGLKLGCLYLLAIRPRLYINRFDVMLFALSLGLGQGIMRAFMMALDESLLRSLHQSLLQIPLLMGYQAVMGWCIIKYIEGGERGGKGFFWLALLLPALLQYGHETMAHAAHPMAVTARIALEALLLLGAGWLTYRVSVINRVFPHADAGEVLAREGQRPTFRQKISYRFDTLMSAGNLGLIGVLLLLCAAVVVVVGLLVYWKSPGAVSGKLSHAIWAIAMRMIDSGNVSADLQTGSRFFVGATVFTTVFGLIGLSSLIGIISNVLSVKLEKLRAGHAKILEKGHVLFLGVSGDMEALLEYLLHAKRGRKRLNVVLMDDVPQEKLEAQVPSGLLMRKGIRVMVRRGNICDAHALQMVNLMRARYVVISGQDEQALTCAMGIKHLLGKQEDPGPRVALLLRDRTDRLAAARYLDGRFKVFHASDISFQPLLRAVGEKHFLAVYQAMTSFLRTEAVSVVPARAAAGKGFYDLAGRYRFSTLAGLIRQGEVVLRPGKDAVVAASDSLIFIKNPRDPLGAGWLPPALPPVPVAQIPAHTPEGIRRVLVLGTQGADSLMERLRNLSPDIRLDHLPAYDTARIEESVAAAAYDLVLCLRVPGMDGEKPDSHLMPHLLLLHELLAGQDCYLCAVLKDNSNARYAYTHHIVDLVLADERGRLIALDILEENSPVKAVEEALFFGPGGFRLVPAQAVAGSQMVKVGGLTSALASQGILLLGYVRHGQGHHVCLNPNKNDTVAFQEGDELIVL